MNVQVHNSFMQMVDELVNRCKVYEEAEGWAVEIDGEVVTWAVSEDKARSIAINLIASGI